MADPFTLATIIPIITGGISAAVQIAISIVKFWQAQKDRRIQAQTYESTSSTSAAAKELQSVMGVHSSFWKKNPTMFQALGSDAARRPLCLRLLKGRYPKGCVQPEQRVPESVGAVCRTDAREDGLEECFSWHWER